jgi:hypothetical protein
VLFSGNLTAESWNAAINSGCRHVFAKPLALSSIIALCTELLLPRTDAVVPESSRHFLESVAWQGTLGTTLRELSDYLLAGRSPLFLQSPGGRFPHELLLLLLPELQPYPRPDSPPPHRPLFTDLCSLDLDQQHRIAQLLPSRRDIPWLLCADAAPEAMLERGGLAKSLYLRISSVVFHLPPPADCAEDTLHLCRWWLGSQPTPRQLGNEAAAWLANQLPRLNWQALLALLHETSADEAPETISPDTLQRSLLALTLGPGLADFPPYAEYADHQTRQLRSAWESLGSAPPP